MALGLSVLVAPSPADASHLRVRCELDANATPSVTYLSASRGIGCNTANVLAGSLSEQAGRRFPTPLPRRFRKTWEIDREQGTSDFDRFACRNRVARVVEPERRFTRQVVTCTSRQGASFRASMTMA